MFTRTKPGCFCSYCEKKRLAVWQTPNIALHSVLVVATCGLWLPIWLIVVVFGGGWVCKECGTYVR